MFLKVDESDNFTHHKPEGENDFTCATQEHTHTQWRTHTYTCDLHCRAAAEASSHLENINTESRHTPLIPDRQISANFPSARSKRG